MRLSPTTFCNTSSSGSTCPAFWFLRLCFLSQKACATLAVLSGLLTLPSVHNSDAHGIYMGRMLMERVISWLVEGGIDSAFYREFALSKVDVQAD